MVEDFAFNEQKNFFTIPPNCKLPLGDLTPRNTSKSATPAVSLRPLGESVANLEISPNFSPETTSTFSDTEFAFCGPAAPVSLSLIEEVTECSSSSVIKSANSTPRPQNPEHKHEPQSATTSHIPKILNTMSPRESQEYEKVTTQSKTYRNNRNISNTATKKSVQKESPREGGGGVRESREMVRPLRQRLRPLDSTLPSKSQPGTPRDDDEVECQVPMERYTKAKPRVVGRRFLRPSPPRDSPSTVGALPKDGSAQKSFQSARVDPLQHRDPRPMADPPVQTKTGLTVTRPRRDSASPPVSRSASREMIPRSASSASLLLHPPPSSTMVPRHGLSRSSGNLATSHPTPSYGHVQSKVRQYIREVKSLPKKELSRSCGNLSPTKTTLQVPCKEAGQVHERPKTAEAQSRSFTSTALRQQSVLSEGVSNSKRSKSETNLRRLSLDNLQQPLQLSKSSISLAFGNLDHLFESSGEDTARTSIFKPLFKPADGEDEVEVCPEDLLALVFQEREGKQETKKVLDTRI